MSNPSNPARHIPFVILLGLCICILISACTGLEVNLSSNSQQAPIYLPPTLAVSPTPSSSPSTSAALNLTPTSILASPTPACSDNLTFLEDQTIPDGSLVQPGESLDKRWLVENSGTCNWNRGYRLKLMAGPEMGANGEQALYPGRASTQVSIRLVFIAPTEPGAYRSAWQAYNDHNEAFGDPIFIDIIVQ